MPLYNPLPLNMGVTCKYDEIFPPIIMLCYMAKSDFTDIIKVN